MQGRRIRIAVLLAAMASGATLAQSAKTIDIAPQGLQSALRSLAGQAGIELLFGTEEVRDLPVKGLHGSFTAEEAMARLLQGTGYTFKATGQGSFVVQKLPDGAVKTFDPIVVRDAQQPAASKTYKAQTAAIAGKVPVNPREIPNSVSVLTRKQMDDQDMVTIGEAMRQATGVTVVANDTANNQYWVRGYGLGVMYDGIPSYNGMTPSNQLDLSAYEQVEVLRGPAGLMRGSGEPGGVVNFVKKRPKDAYEFSGSASVGTWANRRIEGDVTGSLNKDKTLRGRLVVSDEDRGYFYDHTEGKKWLALGALEFDLTPQTTLSLSLAGQDQDVKAPWSGLPAYQNLTDPNNGVYPLLDVSRSTFNVPDWGKLIYHTEEDTAGIEHRFDNQWVAKVVGNHRRQHQYYKYAFTSTGVNPLNNQVSYRSFAGDYIYTRDGLDLYANGPFQFLGRTHNFLIGYNSEVYNSNGKSGNGPNFTNLQFGNTSTIIEPVINYTSGSESETTQSGLYSQARFSIADPLNVIVGARTTTFKIRTRNVAPSATTAWKDGAKADNEITPYAAALYDLTKQVTLYGSYADIFVPQTQLKSGGGTLDPRTGHQYELGIKSELLDGKLAASLAAFDIRDINRAFLDPGDPSQTHYLNAGEVESKGWEIETSGTVLPGLEVIAGYTNLTTKYLSDRTNQGKLFSILSPRHQLKLWGNYRFADDSGLAGLSIGLGLLAQSETQSTRGWRDQLLNSGRAVVNGRIAYDIDKNYSLSLLINNVFDRKYYDTVGTPNIYNFYGEPRNFQLTLKARFH